MLAIFLSIFPLTTLSYSSETSWSQSFRADLTCCPEHTDEISCAAEQGSNCVWVDTSHEGYIQTGDQCLGEKFEKCIKHDPQGCCGGCCDCNPKDKFVVPPGIVNPPEDANGPVCGTTPGTPEPTVKITPQPTPKPTEPLITPEPTAGGPSLPYQQGLPVDQANGIDVSGRIDAAQGTPEECKNIKESNNCWTGPGYDPINTDYSTNDVWFKGVYKNGNNNCCYKYQSIYTGNLNCVGKWSAQSHLVFDIRCQPDDYDIVTAESSPQTSYGQDGSTCYTGIKINTACEDQCDYEICIDFKNTDECKYTTSWVMDKAGSAFSFNSLNGIPYCEFPSHHGNDDMEMFINGLFYDESAMTGISMFGWVSFMFTIAALFCIYKCYGKICQKDGKYIAINDGNMKGTGYDTFSSV